MHTVRDKCLIIGKFGSEDFTQHDFQLNGVYEMAKIFYVHNVYKLKHMSILKYVESLKKTGKKNLIKEYLCSGVYYLISVKLTADINCHILLKIWFMIPDNQLYNSQFIT
jgi:hypothetical protein